MKFIMALFLCLTLVFSSASLTSCSAGGHIEPVGGSGSIG